MLASQPADSRARAAIWIQLVDLLAQDTGQFSVDQRAIAIHRLAEWREDVPERRRLASAASLGSRELPLDLVRFFARDSASVAAPIIARTQLAGGDWQDLLSTLPPASRSVLRERQDLPPETVRALGSFGSSDFALTDESSADKGDAILELTEPVETPTAPPVSIHELVERIENWRHQRRTGKALKPVQRPVSDFAFETGADGVINWVEGAPRGALIGISIATMAETGGWGVDGQTVGAFRKRAEIREAPLTIAGDTAVSGAWHLIADPRFDEAGGRFLGYLGTARRPKPFTTPAPSADLPSGSIRQLVHELRTPLNAIRGFGEMIEGQFLGPVAPRYRERARAIVHDSGELLRVFEDLDANARLESGDYPMSPDGQVDLSEIVRSVAALHADLVEQRGIRLRIALPARPGLLTALDRPSALRMVDRLLGAALSTTEPGDVIELALHTLDCQFALTVSTANHPELDDEVDSFAPLGRDFALRLAARLAERVGGRLERPADSFRLILPQMEDSAIANRECT
ncbi:MAG: hypothetical protein RL367_439 [Pseudomonadota bacterium]